MNSKKRHVAKCSKTDVTHWRSSNLTFIYQNTEVVHFKWASHVINVDDSLIRTYCWLLFHLPPSCRDRSFSKSDSNPNAKPNKTWCRHQNFLSNNPQNFPLKNRCKVASLHWERERGSIWVEREGNGLVWLDWRAKPAKLDNTDTERLAALKQSSHSIQVLLQILQQCDLKGNSSVKAVNW